MEIRVEEATERVQNKLVDEGDFAQIRLGLTAKELLEELLSKRLKMEDLLFTHGDYYLPNIIINKGVFSGSIDWGRAGKADRF